MKVIFSFISVSLIVYNIFIPCSGLKAMVTKELLSLFSTKHINILSLT